VPNGTLCYDQDLARIGFMKPVDVVEAYISSLEAGGLVFVRRESPGYYFVFAAWARKSTCFFYFAVTISYFLIINVFIAVTY
jgi:hypothetical protein